MIEILKQFINRKFLKKLKLFKKKEKIMEDRLIINNYVENIRSNIKKLAACGATIVIDRIEQRIGSSLDSSLKTLIENRLYERFSKNILVLESNIIKKILDDIVNRSVKKILNYNKFKKALESSNNLKEKSKNIV